MLLSLDNPKIKLAKKLKDKKFRDQENKFVIEGIHLVEEAVKNKASIEYILYSKELRGESREPRKDNFIFISALRSQLSALSANQPHYYEVSQSILTKISTAKSSSNIIAVINKPHYGIENIFNGNQSILICDNIQDPGNLGTLIRTAAAAGFGGVIISKGSADPYGPKAVQSTQGAIFSVPCIETNEITGAISIMKEKNFNIIAADLSAEKPYFEAALKRPAAVIIGNEGAGIKSEILDLCDERVKIPMKNNIESLNAAVAGAIIMFEVERQKRVRRAQTLTPVSSRFQRDSTSPLP